MTSPARPSEPAPQPERPSHCALCQDRGYYLARFADGFYTPCRCPAAIAGPRLVT